MLTNIGKGFGVTVGVFLALLVSVSVLEILKQVVTALAR